jgi:site-specific DNA-cytosine methylase
MSQALPSGRNFLKIRDAARLIGVSENTLRNWDRAGHLRAFRHPINGYRLYRVADLHALLDRVSDLPLDSELSLINQQLDLSFVDRPVTPQLAPPLTAELPCHWTMKVALDPKHRPQTWNSPSSTVRRDWRKFPQEAHVLDREERHYRRLTVDEIAVLQGFDPKVVHVRSLSERQRIAALGDAVPPPIAKALISGIGNTLSWNNRTAIEICAGMGGLAEGAAAAELTHLLLIDSSLDCASLLKNNRPWVSENVVTADVKTFDFSRYCERVGLLSGGPPCQPWSQSGLRGGSTDQRDLLGFMPELVASILPEVFLFENVPGLAMFDDGKYLNNLVWRLREPKVGLRYGVLVAVLNAADFGVPQIRKRLFILGLRGKLGSLASDCFDAVSRLRTHRDPSTVGVDLPNWRSVGDALQNLADPGTWRKWIGGGIG